MGAIEGTAEPILKRLSITPEHWIYLCTNFESRYGCTNKDLLTAKRGSGVDNTARAMAMKLCQEQGSMKLLEIRELFGLGSDSGVTKVVSRLNARMEQERELVSCYNVLCRDMTP